MSFNFRNVLAGAVFAATFAIPAQAADVTLKVAGTLPAEHFGSKVLQEMADEIVNAGVGITVDVFPAGQLGSGEELFDDAKFGNVDIVHATIYPQADQRLEYMSLPFLITTEDELREKVADPESEFNTILAEILMDHGIKHLSTIGEGLIGMVATKMPADVHGVGSKEMNIRVWSSQLVKMTMEKLGYRTTTMSWAEVFPAVQSGTIDGAICCTPEWAYTTFAASDVGSTYVPYNAFLESQVIYANGASWGRLNDEQKAVVQAAASTAAAKIIDQSWERTEGFVQQLRDKEWEIVEFTQEQRDAIREVAMTEVWPTVGETIGQDLLDRLMK